MAASDPPILPPSVSDVASSERITLPATALTTTSVSAQTAPTSTGSFLLALVVILGFLLASTVARNSDLWLHLATGRAIAEGSCSPGIDPFTISGGPAAAHTWLSDLLLYGLYQLAGGPGLVLAKALLVVLLALVLVRLGAAGQRLAIPALAAALTLLALSNRLMSPRPVLVSYLFLPLTLWLMEGWPAFLQSRGRPVGWLQRSTPVLLLFTLWSNLDDWFLLGPLTVFLCAVGTAIGAACGRGGREKALAQGLTALAGLAVCLLNPAHVHGLRLPAETSLSPAAAILEQDPVLQSVFWSPLQQEYRDSGQLWTVHGISYLLLALLGAVSFFYSLAGARTWRLPVWACFLLLSCWSIQLMPFFALVAGPVLALNVQDLLAQPGTSAAAARAEVGARLGHGLVVVLLVLALVAAWPGWLQGPPYEVRRWNVVLDPTLKQTADRLHEWRQQGASLDQGLLFSTETANYLAWLFPTEKAWVSSRLRPSEDVAADFVTVRRAFRGEKGERSLRDVLAARKINHLIVYDNEPVRFPFVPLLLNPGEWPLLSVRGRLAVFGWHDPRGEAGPALPIAPVQMRSLAFDPAVEAEAPPRGPERPPTEQQWWDSFLHERPGPSPDRDEAAFYLLFFRAQQGLFVHRNEQRGVFTLAAATLVDGSDSSLAGLSRLLVDRNTLHRLTSGERPQRGPDGRLAPVDDLGRWVSRGYLFGQDEGPVELLLLAIRSARRAIGANPDEARAYLILGEAYLALARQTRERMWMQAYGMVDWRRIRQLQAITAFQHALVLEPGLTLAHDALAAIYEEMNHPDLALHHLRQRLELARHPPTALAGDLGLQAQAEALERRVQQLEQTVEQREKAYRLASANQKTNDRAFVAIRLGLAQTALDLLLSTEVLALGTQATQLQLELMLSTGQADKVRDWLTPDLESVLGVTTYRLARLEAAAAWGDYEEAEEDLLALSARQEQPVSLMGQDLPCRAAMAAIVGKCLLSESGKYTSPASILAAGFNESSAGEFLPLVAAQMDEARRKQADVAVLRALLALEQGNVSRVRDRLTEALAIGDSPPAGGRSRRLDFERRPVALEVQAWIANGASRKAGGAAMSRAR